MSNLRPIYTKKIETDLGPMHLSLDEDDEIQIVPWRDIIEPVLGQQPTFTDGTFVYEEGKYLFRGFFKVNEVNVVHTITIAGGTVQKSELWTAENDDRPKKLNDTPLFGKILDIVQKGVQDFVNLTPNRQILVQAEVIEVDRMKAQRDNEFQTEIFINGIHEIVRLDRQIESMRGTKPRIVSQTELNASIKEHIEALGSIPGAEKIFQTFAFLLLGESIDKNPDGDGYIAGPINEHTKHVQAFIFEMIKKQEAAKNESAPV